MEVRILNYREGRQFDNDKALGTFDVEFEGSVYIDIRLMAGKNGSRYISYPCKKREDASGKAIYVKYYSWTKERTAQFDKMILEALKGVHGNSIIEADLLEHAKGY